MKSFLMLFASLGLLVPMPGTQASQAAFASGHLILPSPVLTGSLPLEAALHRRRSVRNFAPQPLTLAEVSQLLWAAQGITSPDGKRTAPSAGARYPLEIHLVAGEVTGLPQGIYRYRPADHALSRVAKGDLRTALAAAALGQQRWIADSAAAIVVTAIYSRSTAKYGDRGIRYAHLEAGHAAQNVSLQAVALGLGTTVVGALDDRKLINLLRLSADEQPLSILPIGRVR
jgi:SagB-type dehydrogenase family enzyme